MLEKGAAADSQASVADELLIWKASDLRQVANKTGSAEGHGDTSAWGWDQPTLESGNGMTYSLIFLPIVGLAPDASCVFDGCTISTKLPYDQLITEKKKTGKVRHLSIWLVRVGARET